VQAAVFGQAIREYLRARRLIPWIILSFICFLLAKSWHFLDPGADGSAAYSAVSSILVFHLLALTSAIFTTAIISQEVEQKTIVYLLTRPVPRWMLLLTRYVASVLVVAALGIFSAILTAVGAGSSSLLAGDCFAILVGAMAYGAIFLFVSLLFNRSLIICILYAFGWEAAIPNLPGEMYRLSVFSYLQAIAEHPSEGDSKGLSFLTGTAGSNALSRGSAMTTMVVMTVVLLALAAWWFTKFEYVPREDAE